MKGILQRALVVNGIPAAYKQSATLHEIHSEGWLTSLIQMHQQLDQSLAIGGTALANTTEQLILDKHNIGALFEHYTWRHHNCQRRRTHRVDSDQPPPCTLPQHNHEST